MGRKNVNLSCLFDKYQRSRVAFRLRCPDPFDRSVALVLKEGSNTPKKVFVDSLSTHSYPEELKNSSGLASHNYVS